MSEIFSFIGGAYRLIIDVPVFGIGILVGGFGYRWLLKSNPTLLSKLVASVEAEAKVVTGSSTTQTPTPTPTPGA
jgi:hypothetical protein